MDAKFKTPKFVTNTGSSSFVRELLITVLATTISIALTFGTAAIIDFYKKQSEKQEIVMMVMYDMYNSLESIEDCDSTITNAIEAQLQLAQDTTRFDELYYTFLLSCPYLDYTETIEHIFSSSIETINTVDNLLFTQNVAEFYLNRKQYTSLICDSLTNSISKERPFSTLKATLAFDFSWYAIASQMSLEQLQELYAQCKQMMDISDDEIDAYLKRRKHIEENPATKRKDTSGNMDKILLLQQEIQENAEQLNLE